MDDLISRQQLREAMYHEAFEKDSDLQRWDGGCWIRYKLFEIVIDKLPSRQRDCVDVVRCDDCKYGHKITFCEFTLLSCNYKNANGMLVENDGYCKWGERRD